MRLSPAPRPDLHSLFFRHQRENRWLGKQAVGFIAVEPTPMGFCIALAARLDFAEVLRSRWLVFCPCVHALLALMFVRVGLRESGVIGFTGMGRALVLCFTAIGLLVSTTVRNQARALMPAILIWAAGVALIDFALVGVMLQ